MIIKKLAYHRNGVGGMGFHVAIADDEDGSEKLLIRMGDKDCDDKAGAVLCAVFDLGKLKKDDIAFGSNSWRGDRYVQLMDEEIEHATGC